MKKTLIKNITLIAVMLAVSCKQEVITLKPPFEVVDHSCENATKGSADFTKFVAVGSSYTAGFQAGALFTDGQNNSLPAILNKQFVCAGGTATFNQPTIGSDLGYNIFVSPNPDANSHIFGRMLLQYNGATSPLPTPQLSSVGAIPNPGINPGFIYAGTSSALNNFGVEAITLVQYLITNTGNWGDPNPAHGFSPFYARFASDHGAGTTKLINDAAAAGGSFFMFWGGMDDFMLYAAYGGDGTKAPLTSAADFQTYYGGCILTMLGSNPNLKGVVVNFPDIFSMPHFTSVPYNPIPLDSLTSVAVNSGFAGYNAALDGLIANKAAFGISDNLAAEIATRKVTFAFAANNKILITDESLTDLGPYFDGLQGVGAITPQQRAQLAPYQQVRQTTPSDILPLAAGSIIGTEVGGNPLLVNGVSVPLADQYVLIPSEQLEINTARETFNATIAAIQGANSDKLALADVSTGMATFVASQGAVLNGVTLTPNINPPTGIYSEDGLHPNSRGYAFYSTMIIKAINAKFGASVPPTNVSLYSATALPIP